MLSGRMVAIPHNVKSQRPQLIHICYPLNPQPTVDKTIFDFVTGITL
jgi:hypothetical protein